MMYGTKRLLTNVIPAKAGIQKCLKLLDPDFRRDDKKDLCQHTANKGSAAVEFVLLFPLLLLFLVTVHSFFKAAYEKESELIAIQQKERGEALKEELSLPILKKICDADRSLCEGRKK